MSEEFTTIRLRKETKEFLEFKGHKSETYDDIINRLLKKQSERK